MATITIVNRGSGIRVRAISTGGYGSQEAITDSRGQVHLNNSANRTRIQVWSPKGTRWVDTGDVLPALRGEHCRIMPF